MRTTLRLDNDVVALIKQVRKAKDWSLKKIVNTSLREGLALMMKQPTRRKKFRTAAHSCGKCYLPSLDNPAEVLATGEGEGFK